MARRDRLAEIQNVKGVLDKHGRFFGVRYSLEGIHDDALKAESAGRLLDIFPVRAVSRAEVNCRKLVRDVVGHSHQYAERAVPLLANSRVDYTLLISVSADEVTFSDIVAHTVSFSMLSDSFRVFEQLLDAKLSDELIHVTDEDGFAPQAGEEPIINDFGRICADTEAIYSLRHRICHENLDPRADDLRGIVPKLLSFTRFYAALSGFVIRRLHPNLPRTQLEMNLQAGQGLKEAREEMHRYIDSFRDRYKDWPDEIARFDAAQSAWEKFVEAQQILRHDPNGGGSIGPFLRALEAEELTKERIKHLRRYAERTEGDL